MTCHGLVMILISLIFPLSSVIAAHSTSSSSVNDHDHQEVSLMKMGRKVDHTAVQDMDHHHHHHHQMQTSTSVESTESGETTAHLRPWKNPSPWHHQHHLIRNAHGILNIMGWGTLLPVGVIFARYFRKFPLQYDEWYPIHILCQSSAYLLGTLGWGIGLWLGNSSKQYTLKTHRILGILVFTFSTIQMLVIFLQPRKLDKFRRCWEICHHVLGYALVALSIANIFQGIAHQSHAEKWKWVYVGVLAILALVALGLEVFRWAIKYKIQHQIGLDSNMYNFS